MELIEKMARAIMDHRSPMQPGLQWNIESDENRDWYRGLAQAALTALIEHAGGDGVTEALRAENARLREALRVYAGPMEWTQEGGWGAFPVWADGYPGGVYVDDNTLDYGDAARAALKENPNAG